MIANLWYFVLLLVFSLLTFSFRGRLSPKLVSLIIGFLFLGLFCFDLMKEEYKQPSTSINEALTPPNNFSDSTIIKTGDTSAKGNKSIPFASKPDEQQSDRLTRNRTPIKPIVEEEIIPTQYEVQDEKLQTYQAEGLWAWDMGFIQAIERRTGWRKSKKGNYTININYTGVFREGEEEGKQIYTYSGGQIEIKVNDQLCCCTGIIEIPEGLSTTAYAKTEQAVQEKMTDLILQNEEIVIEKIKKCF